MGTEDQEEEIKTVLNEKIKDSVRLYYGKWHRAEKGCDEFKHRV